MKAKLVSIVPQGVRKEATEEKVGDSVFREHISLKNLLNHISYRKLAWIFASYTE